MSYHELLPTVRLRPYVECYWIRHCRFAGPPTRILPDGCIDILFFFTDRSATVSSPVLVGSMTRSIQSQLAVGVDVLGIRFKPGGIFPFLQTPLHLFTDEQVDVSAVSKQMGDESCRRLSNTDDWALRIEWIDQQLLALLLTAKLVPLSVSASVGQLLAHHGQVGIEWLADHSGASRRQLERQFQQYVGVSPKLLARILRFRHLQERLRTRSPDSLMSLAFDVGYTDHAHLTKDFKEFAGITPSAFGADLNEDVAFLQNKKR